MNARVWTPFQKAIFKDIADGKGHSIIEAVAGSGKTTSLIEGFKHVPRGKKSIALAFNKIIQTELRERAPSYIQDVLTFHSLGLRAIKQRFKNVVIDDYKVFNIVKEMGECGKEYDLMMSICDTVAYCKYELVDAPVSIDKIIMRFGVDTCEMDRDQFIKSVIKTLAADKADTTKIDFNDMCYFPFVYDLFMGHYDYVFLDEFQDVNKSQAMMAQRVCRPLTGRIIALGDSKQNLYSWRGSDTSIITAIKKEVDSKVLTLPISYRCPKTVVELVKPWVNNMSCPDNANEGTISNISLSEMYKSAKPGCFILSRVNAPLIKICMEFIRNHKRCNIRGRDIGKQLTTLIKKSKKKQIPAFLKWLDNWKQEEVEKLQAKKVNTENVLDRHECLVSLCEECSSLDEVKEKIDELFDDSDEKSIIILSSTHRAKGLEREEVFLLRWTYRQWFDNIIYLDEENEELNIAYVACTRSKNKLYLVNKF